MIDNSDDVIKKGGLTITYYRWTDLIFKIFKEKYKLFFISSLGLLGILLLLIDVGLSYYQDSFLSDKTVLYIVILFCFIVGVVSVFLGYFNSEVKGLNGEPKSIQKIVLRKKLYWSFKLTSILLKKRLSEIDKELDNVINNRKYIEIKKELSLDEYIDWVNLRPKKTLRLIKVSKQLLITDLFEALNFNESNEEEKLKQLINQLDLIVQFYKDLYEFEVEQKEIAIPESAEKVHSLQVSWVPNIRDSINQMLNELEIVGNRKRKDKSPIRINLVLESPENIDEFINELRKLY